MKTPKSIDPANCASVKARCQKCKVSILFTPQQWKIHGSVSPCLCGGKLLEDIARQDSFTPGPWEADGQVVIHEATRELLADCFVSDQITNGPANAALMAESPMMLAALERLLGCPALNFDDLEPEDIAAYREALEIVARAKRR